MTEQTRPRGRPRESRDGELREHRLFVPVTDQERDYISEQAEARGVSVAEWVRQRALRGYKPKG